MRKTQSHYPSKSKLRRLLLVSAALLSISAKAQWTSLSSGTTNDLKSIHFPTNNIGYVVGKNSTILKTTDAGTTWTPISSFASMCTNCLIEKVHFANKDTGYIAGETDPGSLPHGAGFVFKTRDGGASWTSSLFDSPTPVRDFLMLNKDTLFACGGAEMTEGKIWKSVDAGLNWIAADTVYTDGLLGGLCFFNSKSGFVALYESASGKYNPFSGTWLKTIDACKNFSKTLMPSSLSYFIFSSDAPSSKYAYMSRATYSVTDSVYIRKTKDAGATWTEKAIPGFVGSLYGMDFIDTSSGYMVGNAGKILKTINGANSWTNEVSGTSKDLRGVQFLSANIGYAVGDEGTILRYKNTTSIAELSHTESQISLYPNPASTTLNIVLSAEMKMPTISVYNLEGQVVLQQANFNDHKIEIGNLAPGIYFLKASAEQAVATARFVKN